MAYFISTSGKNVLCYGGTHCSGTKPAELTDEAFISKARRNPDFTEFIPEVKIAPVVKKTRSVRKKKRAYKRKAK